MATELEYVSSPIEPHNATLEIIKEKIDLMVNCFDQLEMLKDDHEHFTENVSHIKARGVSLLEAICAAFGTFELMSEKSGCKIIDLEYENAELRSTLDHYKELSDNLTERVEKLKSYLKETENENQTLIIQVGDMHQEIYAKEYQRMEIDGEVVAILERLEEENRELRAQAENLQKQEQKREKEYFESRKEKKMYGRSAERLDGDEDYESLFDNFQEYQLKAEAKQKELEKSLSLLKKQLKTIFEDNIKMAYKSNRATRKDRFASLPSDFKKWAEQRASFAPPFSATRRETLATLAEIGKNNDLTSIKFEEKGSRNLNELAQRKRTTLSTEEVEETSLNFLTPTKNFDAFFLDTVARKELERSEQKSTVSGFRLMDLTPGLQHNTSSGVLRKASSPEIHHIRNIDAKKALKHQSQRRSAFLDCLAEKHGFLNSRKGSSDDRRESLLRLNNYQIKQAEMSGARTEPIEHRLIHAVELKRDMKVVRIPEETHRRASGTSSVSNDETSSKSEKRSKNKEKPPNRAIINVNKLSFASTMLLFTIVFCLKVSCNTFAMFWRILFHRKS